MNRIKLYSPLEITEEAIEIIVRCYDKTIENSKLSTVKTLFSIRFMC